MTLVSRITGLVRDMVFTALIGAGFSADAFYVAFRIPNFFRRIFGEGGLSQAFVPVFAEYHARAKPEEARRFVEDLTGTLALVLFVVTLIGVVAAPLLVLVLATGFYADPAKLDLTVTMLRIMFPYLFFVSLVALAAGVLNTYGRFGAAAFTPVLLNLSLIGAAVFLAPRFEQPVVALAWGVFIAGFVQLLFQIPFLKRVGMLPRLRFEMHEGVRRVALLMVPGVFGTSVAQINLLVNTFLASFLATGSIAWLYLGDRMMEFALGTFGIALATVILPSLSQKHAADSPEEFSHLLDWALRWALIISMPATAALIVLSGPMYATFFYFGKFTPHDVEMSAQALDAFAFGLLGFTLIRVLASGFYARQDTKTPMRKGVYSVIANVVLSLALVYPLRHVGLALAISLAACMNAVLLYARLRRLGIYRARPGWKGFFARVILATSVMTGLVAWGNDELRVWLASPPLVRAGRLAFWIAAGIMVYGAVLLLAGMRLRHLKVQAHPHVNS
jgi:putative peptidoglycan lipid II flippase